MDLTTIASILLAIYFLRKLYLALNPSFLSVKNKSILITGCDSGFGLQLGHRAIDDGLFIFAGCLNGDSDGAKELKEKGAVVLVIDVTQQKSIDEALVLVQRELTARGLSLHGVVNNAGVNLSVGPIEWASPETVARVLDVNTLGGVRVTRTFLPLVRKTRGRIVNVCSMASHIAAPGMLSYSISKAASFFYSIGLRRELMKFGVHVASVCPTYYTTNIVSKELVKRCVEKAWAEATPEAKADYGREMFERLVAGADKDSRMARHQIWEVSDCIMDALLNANPKCDYITDTKTRIAKFVLDMIPLSWGDYIVGEMMKQ